MADLTRAGVRLFRFGPFELDVRSGELRKHGIRLQLREQPVRILLLLLAHPGELVLRDEIRDKLWPNETMVEFDPAINNAIRRLRDALGESAEKPRYVETVARRGYRFLGEVEAVETPTSEPSASAPLEIDADDLEGKTVSHYLVLDKLGRGGMGIVFRAKDLRLKRNVALKFLPGEYSKQAQPLERFQQEARAAAALNHPNICTIYEIGEHQSRPFMAMELLEGRTLKDVLADGELELEELLGLAVQIAGGLEAAHRRGVVHRDIKPANLFVTPHRQIKILDFGLAKLLSGHSLDTVHQAGAEEAVAMAVPQPRVPGALAGTAAYMSPEQVRGGEVDARSDIFSLGVVLYEMAGGKRPFGGGSSAETMDAILRDDPPALPSYIPKALDRLVRRCLEKAPDGRFQSAADLALALISLSTMGKPEPYQAISDSLVDLRRLKNLPEFEAEPGRHQTPEENIPVVSARSLPPNNLSVQVVSLVGREREIEQICDLLRCDGTRRLLTLTGVGGTGKTTLAQAVARQLRDEFSDGVFFIELAAVKQAELVASTIAQPLGVKAPDGKPSIEALKDYSRGRNMLLVLDNFEHLATAASLVTELLAAAPRLKIVVTSRAPLHLSLEREYLVPPLATPETSGQFSPEDLMRYEAVRLFVERACGADANFVLTDENARSVAEICVRVDGLPLAIELAAARVRVLSPRAILSRLDRRLKLLTGGALDLPTRQQTISGAMEWSYELLSAGEKQWFRRLAVFAGGFTLEAAEGVVVGQPSAVAKHVTAELMIEALEGITSLVDKSLLVPKPQSDGEVRFRMLEVVREYALDRLEASGEAQQMRRHHAAYFLGIAEEAEPHLHGPQPAKWLRRLEEEHGNIRAALRWSLACDAGMAARLGAAIRYFWVFQGHLAEGLAVLQEILMLCDRAPTTVRWKLLSMAGNLARYQGDYETARRLYEEGLSDGRSVHDLRQVSLSCRGLGGLAFEQGDYPTARGFAAEALSVARQSNDRYGIARSLNMIGDLARAQGQDAAARPLYEESIAICRQLGNNYATANILTNLAAAEFGEGHYSAAHAHFTEGLTMLRESSGEVVGDKISVSYLLDGLAALAALRGETELAATVAGSAEHLRESINYNVEPAERRFRDAYIASLRTMLSEEDFSRAYGQGRKLKLDDCVALALARSDSLPGE
jgi:predicted ATPase/serine/threonine protein kinase